MEHFRTHTMTKKHFIAIAKYIRIHNAGITEPFTTEQLRTLAFAFKSQNANFNTERWLAYIAGECGPSGGKVK
jgi:hypothetical protein